LSPTTKLGWIFRETSTDALFSVVFAVSARCKVGKFATLNPDVQKPVAHMQIQLQDFSKNMIIKFEEIWKVTVVCFFRFFALEACGGPLNMGVSRLELLSKNDRFFRHISRTG
jgi:hypothetical protein